MELTGNTIDMEHLSSATYIVNALDTEIIPEKSEIKEKIAELKDLAGEYIPLSKRRVRMGLGVGILGLLSFYYVSTFEKSGDPLFNSTSLDELYNLSSIASPALYPSSTGPFH